MSLAQRAMRAASDLLSRAQIARAAGKSFDGERNVDEALGYKAELRTSDYWNRFERGGISGRIVEAYPKATWREKFELIENEDVETETAFEKAWLDLEKRLAIVSSLYEADVMAGVGRFAVILLGLPGKLDTPVTKAGPDKLVALTVFGEKDVDITEFVTKTEDARFGMPEFYQLKNLVPTTTNSSDVTRSSTQTARVHWTRVIHIREGVTDNKLYGRPRLKRVWNKLDDLDKICGGGAEAAYLRAHQGMQIDVDPEIDFDEDAEQALSDEVSEYQHKLRRTIRTRGATITPLGSDVHNFSSNAGAIIDQIAAISEIPQRILMGSERGQLASEQDDDNWKNRVKDRRTNYAGPTIVRPLIDRLVTFGVLPTPEEYNIQWAEVVELTPKEQADLADKWAGLNAKAGGVVILPEEIRDKCLGLDPLTPQQIAENTPEPPPELAPELDGEGNPVEKPKPVPPKPGETNVQG